jgi:hypothetical protein
LCIKLRAETWAKSCSPSGATFSKCPVSAGPF